VTPFTDFLSHVLPLAPSVPEPLAIQALRNATIEFCERTRSWRRLEEIEVTGDEYEIVPVPAQTSLFEIEEAWFKLTGAERWGKPLKRVAFKEIEPNDLPQEGDTAGTSPPEYITQISSDKLIIVPLATGTLRISMFLTPSQTAEDCDDFLFENYARAIADGALASLLLTPGQPYANPNLGVVKEATFKALCDAKFNQNMRGQQRARTRTRSSFF
jgi:hypothetical protein